mmetsp:Transcript_11430/g.29289  ORF Transcript_11430/g.29289 Transcript_11430/m.29289 type:complete len:117 (+) Transcript_11430:577-927(+)
MTLAHIQLRAVHARACDIILQNYSCVAGQHPCPGWQEPMVFPNYFADCTGETSDRKLSACHIPSNSAGAAAKRLHQLALKYASDNLLVMLMFAILALQCVILRVALQVSARPLKAD